MEDHQEGKEKETCEEKAKRKREYEREEGKKKRKREKEEEKEEGETLRGVLEGMGIPDATIEILELNLCTLDGLKRGLYSDQELGDIGITLLGPRKALLAMKLKSLPSTSLVGVLEFFRAPFPSVTYDLSPHLSSGTKNSMFGDPKIVVEWEHFREELEKGKQALVEKHRSASLTPFSFPNPGIITDEEGLRFWFHCSGGEMIRRIFGEQSFRIYKSRLNPGTLPWKPDFEVVMNGVGIPFEFKTPKTLPTDWTSLQSEYNNTNKNEKSNRLIRQIFSYMSILLKVRYGVLSCYDVTYFFKLEDEKCLLVSEPIKQEEMMEVLACFLSLTPPDMRLGDGEKEKKEEKEGEESEGEKGREEESGGEGGEGGPQIVSEGDSLTFIVSATPCPPLVSSSPLLSPSSRVFPSTPPASSFITPPSSPFTPLTPSPLAPFGSSLFTTTPPSTPSSTPPSSPLSLPSTPTLSSPTAPSLLLASPSPTIRITTDRVCIGSGAVGEVYEATLEGATDIALKIADVSRNSRARYEFQNEVAIYEYLEEAQGEIIPRLMWCGYLDKEHECYGIATTRCFPAHGASEEEKRKVVEKLSQFGVEHGDVRDDNFVRSPDGQLFIIDFGLSELSDHNMMTKPQ